jgi:GTPase SAR1 family protein
MSTPAQSIPTIFLVGEVSSGKSSFLNSLVGGYVANASLQRETLRPNWYQLAPDAGSAIVKKLTGAMDCPHMQKISDDLEGGHRQNEDDRNRITELKLEDMCKLNHICTNDNKLPLRLGVGEYNLIDFPGINDAEDKEGKFIQVIEYHIKKADVLIYLTDASTAFQRESELQSFAKLQLMVNKEIEEGHYIDLIIVVNKFDDRRCPDLNSIYGRITKHTSMPKDKIFRFSSHKMLISNIVVSEKTLYVPRFANRELGRILKTANVIVTKALNKRLKESGKIYPADIQYEEELDTYDDTSSSSSNDNKIKDVYDGDWDKFIAYLEKFNDNLPKYAKNAMIMRLMRWSNNCIDLYTPMLANNTDISEPSANSFSQFSGVIQDLEKLVLHCKERNFNSELIETAIIIVVESVFKLIKGKQFNFVLLSMLFQVIFPGCGKDYINTVNNDNSSQNDASLSVIGTILAWGKSWLPSVKKSKQQIMDAEDKAIEFANKLVHIIDRYCHTLTLTTQVTVVCLMSDAVVVERLSGIILSILQNPASFAGFRCPMYNINTKEVKIFDNSRIKKGNTYGTHASWLIHDLFYIVPSGWRMILKLSITPIANLRSYDRMQVINYNICNSLITNDFRNKFTHYLSITQDNVAGHKLFNISDEVKSYYNDFIEFNKTYNL